MSDDEVEKLRRQTSALSRFGDHALRTDDLQPLLQEATELVSQATGIELVKVLELLLPDGDAMLVCAGVGWNTGVVGHAKFAAHRGSPGGYALREEGPVISPDTDAEDRFEIPGMLIDQSMINVVIRGEGEPGACSKWTRGNAGTSTRTMSPSFRTMRTCWPPRSSAFRWKRS